MSDWLIEVWAAFDGSARVAMVQREPDTLKIEGEWAAENGDVLVDPDGARWRLLGVKSLETQKGGGAYTWAMAYRLDDAAANDVAPDPAQIDLEELIEEAEEAEAIADLDDEAEAAPEPEPELEPKKSRRKKEPVDAGE